MLKDYMQKSYYTFLTVMQECEYRGMIFMQSGKLFRYRCRRIVILFFEDDPACDACDHQSHCN
jgi:hypothetical protein